MIKTIFWEDDAVVMIDQKLLPLEERYVTCRDYREVIAAINDLTVRGAPAIGVAAALGIALGSLSINFPSRKEFEPAFYCICEEFSQTRPTARNLFWAIERMRRCWAANTGTVADIKKALVAEARGIVEEDIAINRRIGRHGRDMLSDGDRILTHCNAGALATAGYGTALGVIRAAHEEGKKIHVFVDETRPILQGARLTAWELKKEDIPATLITDSMAGFLMHRGKVDKVIVGADRIAGNGDVANKIGTYSLAVLARENGIPFYVAAPLSTVDLSINDGSEIPIEERKGEEVLYFCNTLITVPGIDVFNPAFDITPHR
ncbi:MAG: S-methyl-5-thioribose-1-phosphate isomerase, partial [Syntrophales bacterium]|nr:S-methyl-5-thioribose-1-phosphate isomerase [Syntrophales bacterium]